MQVLSFAQHTVEMQQSGRLHNDGGTNDTCRAHEQGTQAGDDPIRGTQVGRALAPAIEDELLMPDQHGLGDNGTESTRPRQSGQGDDQMNEYDSEVAHSGNGINISQTTALRPIWQFAIDYYVPETGTAGVKLDGSTREFLDVLRKGDPNLHTRQFDGAVVGGERALLTRMTTKTSSQHTRSRGKPACGT
jgi:hypothetical protein